MLKPVRTVAPVVAPVSLEEAKAHLRVDHDDDDALISGLVEAATAHLDGWSGILGRALVNQTWAQRWPFFPNGQVIGLALSPVQSIASVTYYDADGSQQTLDNSNYTLLDDELGLFVTLQVDGAWPATFHRADAVTVNYVAGYGPNAADVPAAIRHAILLMVGLWYEHRETMAIGNVAAVQLPLGAEALLSPYRRVRL